MADAEKTESLIYNGDFTQKVDSTRRVVIPSRWLPAKTDGAGKPFEFTLMLWPAGQFGTCLRVLPPQQMAKLLKKIEEMPDTDPNKPAQKRYIGTHSLQVSVDKQGRICLPEDMTKAASIGNEAVLMGCLDRFEIWNVERGAAVRAADAVVAAGTFSTLG